MTTIDPNHPVCSAIVTSRKALLAQVQAAQASGEKVVFTNGCFDILHPGHVLYLQEARNLGDRLIVAINDDDSVRRLKGAQRPINNIDHRLVMLSALSSVDWVIPFHEDTPIPLLDQLRPDIVVKGGDYQPTEVVGWELVEGYGGEVRVLSLVPNISTTQLIETIQGKE